jgi:hypothetical protein
MHHSTFKYISQPFQGTRCTVAELREDPDHPILQNDDNYQIPFVRYENYFYLNVRLSGWPSFGRLSRMVGLSLCPGSVLLDAIWCHFLGCKMWLHPITRQSMSFLVERTL